MTIHHRPAMQRMAFLKLEVGPHLECEAWPHTLGRRGMDSWLDDQCCLGFVPGSSLSAGTLCVAGHTGAEGELNGPLRFPLGRNPVCGGPHRGWGELNGPHRFPLGRNPVCGGPHRG